MTLDSLGTLSTADESKRFPKGIHVIGADGRPSDPKVEEVPKRQQIIGGGKNGDSANHHGDSANNNGDSANDNGDSANESSEDSTSWSYLSLQHQTAKVLLRWLEKYNARSDIPRQQPFFIHKTYRYQYKNKETKQGVKKTLEPTISGLVFLQGTVKSIQGLFKEYFPQFHLVNNCSTGSPARITDKIMQPFMNVMKAHPERVTFLRDPFEKFVEGHVKLRVLTGPFKGYEGYIIRIDRDRQLVFDFGGYAVAISGVHKEDFEEVG